MNSTSAIGHLPSAPRILIRGTNWLGDAVMTTPALLRLREKFPGAHIALLCPEKLRGLWLNHPALNKIISFHAAESVFSVGRKLRRWGETPGEPGLARQNAVTTAREDARPATFDLALVLPNSPRSAIEAWLAGIPQRIGYARPWRNFFLTQAVVPRAGTGKMRKRSVGEIRRLISGTGFQPVSKNEQTGWKPVPLTDSHQIHEYLHLAAALGANPEPLPPQLFVTPDEMATAKKKFGLLEITQPVFGLNPGAEYGPAKRWPVENFIAAAKEIQRRTNCTWIVFGGKGDAEIAN
ncbi:MAG: glycosyltransferase family 9 protein, partial [Verrucomicrobiota bacterium]